MHAYIVVDLGFGDCGKGLLTDALARRTGAGLVVRYNGGAQAGHNVVTGDGHHHTFSQFGSATFVPGVRTYLSRHVVVHPGALLVEGDRLVSQGITDAFSRIRLSEEALIITPFHQAMNRIRELVRGSSRHGSCGVGVGEAVEDAALRPEQKVLAGDLAGPAALRRKLALIRLRKGAEAAELCKDLPRDLTLARELALFESDDVIDAWLASIQRIQQYGLVASDSLLKSWLRHTEHVIFEGAQGVLLDGDFGFHPFTTWSDCTAANAVALIDDMAPGAQVTRVGVLRSHALRHGPGPFPTETAELHSLISEHNHEGAWQGPVRYGWFDAVLGRYALEVAGGMDALMITHMDLLGRLDAWHYCSGYKGFRAPDASAPAAAPASIPVLRSASLERRRQLTDALFAVEPDLSSCPPHEQIVIRQVEALLGRPVDIVSRGPSAGDVDFLHPAAL